VVPLSPTLSHKGRGSALPIELLWRFQLYLGATILVRSDIRPSNAITMSSPGRR
jgi:hypothetical protein